MSGIDIKKLKAEDKAKRKADKQPKTIKVWTLVVFVINAALIIGSAIAIGFMSYERGYNDGDTSATKRDIMVVQRIKEVKVIMTELKK